MHPFTRNLRRVQRTKRRQLRNIFARAVVDPAGPFRQRIKSCGKLYRRKPRHPARAFAELVA